MFDIQAFTQDCSLIRKKSPLILNITNYPAMNFTANVLLAVGASPLMSFYSKEMEELVEQCDALVVNIGCLDDVQIDATRKALQRAKQCKKPWVLDPVGVGISRVRSQVSAEWLELYPPSVIRGNASEILHLAGENVSGKGVDALIDSSKAISGAKVLAQKVNSIVVISGKTDYITDGTQVSSVLNGNAMMGKVTAMGCALTALIGAFLAVDSNVFRATLNATTLMGVVGERSANQAGGVGSFVPMFLDELYHFSPEKSANLIQTN